LPISFANAFRIPRPSGIGIPLKAQPRVGLDVLEAGDRHPLIGWRPKKRTAAAVAQRGS
jgi:hypothetical protein